MGILGICIRAYRPASGGANVVYLSGSSEVVMDVTSDVIFMNSLAYPTRVEYRQVVGSERLVQFLALALYNMGGAPSSGVGVVKCVVNSRRMVLALERTGRSGFDKVGCHQPIPDNTTNVTRPSRSAFPP